MESHRCVPQGCARSWPLFVGSAARGLRCRTRHPSRGSYPVWLLDFCRCSNQSAASPCVNYELMLRSCNARANTSHDCCVRATSTETRQLGFDAAVLPLDACRSGASHVSGPNTLRVRTALRGWLLRRIRSRTSPGPTVPACRASLSRRKTQYKCGNSWVWNNHPLGKARYHQELLLHPPHGFVGVKWLPKPAFRMAPKCLFIPLPMDPRRPAIRAMERLLLEAFRTVGLKA
jgi:hypothetical protein